MGLRKNLVGERKEKEPKTFTEGTGGGEQSMNSLTLEEKEGGAEGPMC